MSERDRDREGGGEIKRGGGGGVRQRESRIPSMTQKQAPTDHYALWPLRTAVPLPPRVKVSSIVICTHVLHSFLLPAAPCPQGDNAQHHQVHSSPRGRVPLTTNNDWHAKHTLTQTARMPHLPCQTSIQIPQNFRANALRKFLNRETVTAGEKGYPNFAQRNNRVGKIQVHKCRQSWSVSEKSSQV